MWRKEGFTLIELMIVIAIIAIIAAIAIPNLLSGRMSANESSAVASLRLFTNAESTWFQQDVDANGVKDYWTLDISCLHRMYRADNTTKVAFIAIDLARADVGLYSTASNPFGAPPAIELWTSVATATKSGYWFQALTEDNATGTAVDYQDTTSNVGTSDIDATHRAIFGFMAAPDVYATSGVNSFIVNQEGTVYANDTGSNNNKWKTTDTYTLEWPSANPAGTNGPSSRPWRVAD
ncbi:MAG: DUF2950 family protein [Planctomycetota bacterium]